MLSEAIQWATGIRNGGASTNAFYYRSEFEAWLAASDNAVTLCNDLRSASLTAADDEQRLYQAMLDRSSRTVDLLTDLFVWMSAVKAGLVLRVPAEMMLPPKYNVTMTSGRVAVGGISLQQPDQEKVQREVEEWTEDYQGHIKTEMEAAVKDMAMQQMVRVGVARRKLKLEHDYRALEALIFTKLFIPVTLMGEYVRQLVHQGAWQNQSQSMLDRYAQIFLARMPWSGYAKHEGVELSGLRADTSWIGPVQGTQYLRIVDAAIRASGGRGV